MAFAQAPVDVERAAQLEYGRDARLQIRRQDAFEARDLIDGILVGTSPQVRVPLPQTGYDARAAEHR